MSNIDDILNVAAQDAVERVDLDNGSVRSILVSFYPPRNMSIDKHTFEGFRMFPFIEYEKAYINGVKIRRLYRLQDISMLLKCIVSHMHSETTIQFTDITTLDEEVKESSSFYIKTSSLKTVLLFDSDDNAEIKNSNYFCWRSDIPKIASVYRLLLDGSVSNDEIVSELMSHHFGCLLGMAESELNERLVIRKWLFSCHIVKDELNFYENVELVGEKTVRFKEDVTNSQIFDDNPNCYEGAYTHAYIVTTRELEDKVFVRSILLILVDRSRGEDSHVCVVKKNVLYIDDEKIFNEENEGILKKFFELCDRIGVDVPTDDRIAIFDELVKTTKELNSKLLRNG